MRALVVYESMYGNTHAVADQVADGLRTGLEVTVVPVADVTADLVAAAELLVVGGPTDAHGMSSGATRRAAIDATKKEPSLSLEPRAAELGVRDWLGAMAPGQRAAAAMFDTRLRAPAAFTGRVSRGIARRLRRHGFRLIVKPESFFVDKHNNHLDGERRRASAWGEALARTVNAPMNPVGQPGEGG